MRFEGPGVFGGSTVRGHIVESRITVIDPVAETVTPRHLNKHIDYDSAFDPAPNVTNDKSLAFPLNMAFTADGSKVYVSAFGSSKVGIYTPAQIEADSFTPDTANQIEVTGGGPTGIVLDEAHSRMFVLTRFDNSVSVIDTAINSEEAHLALTTPSRPASWKGAPSCTTRATRRRAATRPARPATFSATSTRWPGTSATPTTSVAHTIREPSSIDPRIGRGARPRTVPPSSPMKGPMTTQSLRGMDNQGPMHWRGDRTGGNDIVPLDSDAQPNRGIVRRSSGLQEVQRRVRRACSGAARS